MASPYRRNTLMVR